MPKILFLGRLRVRLWKAKEALRTRQHKGLGTFVALLPIDFEKVLSFYTSDAGEAKNTSFVETRQKLLALGRAADDVWLAHALESGRCH